MIVLNHAIAALAPTATQSVRRWLFHLGGLGLIPLGLLDSSIIPVPGSMDVLTIVLSSRQDRWWPYYALMATAGSVIGGFVTYRLARKGGKETLERRFSRQQADRVYKIFGRWGFGAIAIPALLPPPVPMVPFLFAAGALQYPVKKFLAALTLGRTVRYTILAYLASRYGRKIITFIAQHGYPVAWAAIGLVLACVVIIFFLRGRNTKQGAS